ncbi:DUF1415 domain-containing protein [Vibrio sp.]|nr:DUF1415 domain-containing protein [Vibrio sp.]
MTSNTTDTQRIHDEVEQWLDNVVIGLNLCPFAAKPKRNNQIKIHVSQSTNEDCLLEDIRLQLVELDNTPATQLDTTLVVIPFLLGDFNDYNWYIDWVESLLKQYDWEGIYQVATFHPDYYFAGTQPDDSENLTNRSPYPIFHLIREESMEKVLAHYPDPESIPDNNINRVNTLSDEEKHHLFPHLFQ